MSLQPLEMDAEEARERVDRVKAAVTQAREDLVSLWRERAWLSLGYASWDELCDAEFGVRMALPREERREVVADLRAEGMSTPAIASALGISNATAWRDASSSSEEDRPVKVTGLDGYSRPATRPAPTARYPELEHYEDRPQKAEAIAAALDSYGDREREVRREALAASIAAEQRNGGPVRYLDTDQEMTDAHAMYEALSAALRGIERAGGADLFGRVSERVDPLVRIAWADTCTSLAQQAMALSVAIESPKHLRSVQ